MAISVQTRLDGDKELMRLLKKVPDRLLLKTVRPGTAKAMTPVARDARVRAKSDAVMDTGLLAESIGKRTKTYRRKGIVVSLVGPRKGFKRYVVRGDGKEELADPVNYAHLVEFGTAPHYVGSGSSIREGVHGGRLHPGTAPAPFLRPAFDSNEGRVLSVFKNEVRKGLVRIKDKKLR